MTIPGTFTGNSDPVVGPVDYSLYGTSLNNASASNFQLTPADPLVLDLNGDGVKLTNYTDAPVLFDADNDGGSLEQTGWVSNSDGIVVHDLNYDGKINNISETLSEYYNGVAGANGMAGTKPYTNGFAALKSLDSNSDNQFTSADAAWSQLRVWTDANHDGKTDAGELKTFAELGITGINLNSASQSGEVRDGNEVLARGTFTQNGATREAIAANFLANPAGSTITQTSDGVTVTTESTSGGSGNTGVITSFVSQNTVSTLAETLDAAALGVRHITGGTGNDTVNGDAQNNWLAGGLGADSLNGGSGDDVLLMDASDTHIDGGSGLDIAQVVGSQGVMLKRLRELGRRTHLIYCARSRSDAAFVEDIQALVSASHDGSLSIHLHFDDEKGVAPDLAGLFGNFSPETHFYCCGPSPMLEAYEKTCDKLGYTHVHMERFAAAPALTDQVTDSVGYTVALKKSNKTVQVPPGTRLLDALLSAGCKVEFSCQEGLCGACETRVLSGEVEHRDSILTKEERAANKSMMICVSGCRSGTLVLDA